MAGQRRKSRVEDRRHGAGRAREKAPGNGAVGATSLAAKDAAVAAPPRPGRHEPVAAPPAEAVPAARGGLAGWWDTAWQDVTISLALVAVALALFLPRLAVPPHHIYDEIYHAYTAAQFAKGNADAWVWYTHVPAGAPQNAAYEWTHPPLGKLLIAVGILIYGDQSYGWRIMSVIVGAIGVPIMYWLVLGMTKRRPVALLASGLLLIDGLYFVESRTGVLDIFGAVFMLGAFAAFYYYLAAPPDRVRRPLLLLGLFMGLAIATKWNAVYPSALIGLVAVVRGGYLCLRASQRRGETPTARDYLQHLIWVPLGLVLLPGALYMLSYTYFFLAGHTLAEFKELQWQMYYYHSHLKATHDYSSVWYQWPLTGRPVWYSVMSQGDLVANTYANGNPFLYWSFFVAVPYAIYRWRTNIPALLVVLIGFFGQWLPWALVPRLAYIYHFLPAATIGTLCVAVTIGDLWQFGARLVRQRRQQAAIGWQIVAGVWVAAILWAFVFFYPIYTSVYLSRDQFEARIWFDGKGHLINWR